MAVPGGGTLITAGEKFARLGPTVHYVQRLLASHENTDKESGNGTKLMAAKAVHGQDKAKGNAKNANHNITTH